MIKYTDKAGDSAYPSQQMRFAIQDIAAGMTEFEMQFEGGSHLELERHHTMLTRLKSAKDHIASAEMAICKKIAELHKAKESA